MGLEEGLWVQRGPEGGVLTTGQRPCQKRLLLAPHHVRTQTQAASAARKGLSLGMESARTLILDLRPPGPSAI